MPALVAWIGSALALVLRYMIVRVVLLLGLQVVTVTGLVTLLQSLKAQAVAAYGGLPSYLLQWFGLMRVDQALLIVFGALVARLGFRAVEGGVSALVSRGTAAGGKL